MLIIITKVRTMAAERKLFIVTSYAAWPRGRRVTAQMAHDLGISAAYLNLIEHNQRPITVNVLLRLGDAFGVNIQEFALDDSDAQSAALREVLSDPVRGTGPDAAGSGARRSSACPWSPKPCSCSTRFSGWRFQASPTPPPRHPARAPDRGR